MRTTIRPRAAIAALLALPLAAPLAGAQQREPWPGYDAYVEAAMRTWKVPGAAIAIIRNDSLVYARGYGVRELGKPDRVDERTVFAIGSSSKAFTAAGIGMLVDSGKVRLDGPAVAYLPGFQMHDPYVTRELTVRDLLSHRSGLSRGDLMWYNSGYDRDEILRRTRFLAPSWSFRSQFGYQNLMYIAAGQVIQRVSGKSWDDFMKERIFTPLGMTSATSTTISALEGQQDVSQPHAEIEGTVRPIPWRRIDNAGAAGSINSNVVEMAQWVRLHLNKGKVDGKQILSEKFVQEMQLPNVAIRLEGPERSSAAGANLMAYGLGWFLQDYEGEFVVHHGGNIDGMSALVAMIPERKFGMVLLTNMNGTPLPSTLMVRTFDHLLGRPARDWSGEMRKRYEEQIARAREAQKKAEAERVPNTKPTLPIAAYAGTYADSMYGEVQITEQNGKLHLAFGPNFRGELEHWHFNTFRTRLNTPILGPVPVHFRLSPAGKVADVQMDLSGPVTFTRVPDPAPARAGTGGPGGGR